MSYLLLLVVAKVDALSLKELGFFSIINSEERSTCVQCVQLMNATVLPTTGAFFFGVDTTAQTSAQRRKLLDFLKCQGKSRKKIFWHLLDQNRSHSR